MFVNQPSTALLVLSRLPGSGRDQHFDGASGRYSEQAEAKKAAELAHTRIAQAFATRWPHSEPNLITCRCAIYGLQHKIETEGKL
jgi:hypothetical protein